MNECETCAYYIFDEDTEEYVCDCYMDQDDYGRLVSGYYRSCPFYRDGDEYRIVRHQL